MSAPLATLAVALLVAGCTPDASGDPQPGSEQVAGLAGAGTGGEVPPVYVDSIVQPLVEGKNTARENYQVRVETCHEAGLPTTALTDEEVQKLGTTRLQQWLSPERVAIRAEEWVLGTGELLRGEHCRFFLASRGAHKYYNAEGVTTIRFNTGEVEHGPPLNDWQSRGEVHQYGDSLREANERDFGPPVQRVVAGQPCDEWAMEYGTICVWTGGQQWGFTSRPLGMLQINHYTHLMNRVVLAQEPSFPAMNRVELQELRIGQPLDDAQMQPRPPTAWPARKPRG